MDFPRLIAWLKQVPGYNATTPQVLGHDARGKLAWSAAKKPIAEPAKEPIAEKPA